MKANTGKLFNWFWGTPAKQICKRVQEFSTDELMMLFRNANANASGPQKIQNRFIVKEIIKRHI
jgi:hypothetical protein